MNRRNFLKFSAAAGASLALSGFTQAATPRNITVFKTGLPTIDDLLGGGIPPGHLMMVLGEAGSGKTAFCHTLNKANQLKTVSPLLVIAPPGSTDTLSMHTTGDSFLFSDVELCVLMGKSGPSQVTWEDRLKFATERRRRAYEENYASVWTVPVNRWATVRRGSTESYPFHYSPMRVADYAITLNGKKVNLIKNRHGKQGSCNIDFKYNGDVVTMVEV